MQVKENRIKLAISSISVFFISMNFAFSQECKPNEENKDSLITYHFQKLEAAVNLNPKKTKFYGCSGSVMYIEKESMIFSKSDGTFAGKLYFTKSDFVKWRKWYISRKQVVSQSPPV